MAQASARPGRPAAPSPRLTGSRSDAPLKVVPRRQVLAAFVGRLDLETTDKELCKYLSEQGMQGVFCRKLVAKDGTKFKTSAFYVTCAVESRELFYDEKCWPAGVELRDWIYYN